MGKDVKWSEFFEDNRRYADIINGVICKGQQLVSGENLSELDSRSKGKFRDVVRKVAFGINFAIVGIENQDEIDYEFPVRIMEYDVARYRRQISAIKKSIRKKGVKLKPGEYMYGFKKESRLHPVTTIVLYAGEEAWDGPERLHEIIDFADIPESLKESVQDYKIKILDIRRLKDTSMFQTDVRQVFDFIRYAEDWDALYELVNGNSYFQNMDEDAYEVIAKYANINDEVVKMDDYRREDGGVDVCKGIRDLMEHSKDEGREEGREEGVHLGVEQERRSIIINMLEMDMPIEEICKIVRCDAEYVQEITQEIMQNKE